MPEWRELHSPWNLYLWSEVDRHSVWNRWGSYVIIQLYTLSFVHYSSVLASLRSVSGLGYAIIQYLICPIPAIDCGDPGTPSNGQRSLSSTTYNSVVTYTCDVGYILQGSNSRTCQADAQWSGSVTQCTGMCLSCQLISFLTGHDCSRISVYIYVYSGDRK